ncbi:MAG: DUF4349 domain-containing protein [Chloroflexi bacterium]|nr:DUF4349 domain-containing protein [Chloroflexota bacterium]
MLQMSNSPVDTKLPTPRRKGIRRWLKPALAVSAVVVVGAMLLGILSTNQTDYAFKGAKDSVGEAGTSFTPVKAVPLSTPVAANAPAAPKASASTQAGTYNIQSDRMIIRNATLSVQADDVEKFLSDVRALATEQNGSVMQANTTLRDDKTYANLTIQIPALAFDATVSRLRQLAYKVDSENTGSQDVTEEFVDTDAQVRNLKATEASYLELLKKATNVNDTLSIQRELTSVRGEIERRQGRMNYLQKKSDTSTITLSISPRLPTTKLQSESWDIGNVLAQAWEGSLRGLQKLGTVLITVVVYGWWVLPLIIMAYFTARLGWKRLNRSLNRPTPPPADPTQQGATQ